MIGEILTGTKIVETLYKWGYGLYRRIKPVHEENNPTVTSRFIQLFEMHGVHKNQIPSFFNAGITLSDIANETKLLEKLTESVVDDVCLLFGTRKDWLLCIDVSLFDTPFFYKHPDKAQEFINTLVGDHKSVSATLLLDSNHSVNSSDALIFHVPVGEVGGLEIKRHIVITEHTHAYWRSMVNLVAIVAMADKAGIYVDGYLVDAKGYKPLIDRRETFHKGFIPYDSGYLNAEDLTRDPELFIKWIKPEDKKFGTKSALDLFLQYAEKGYLSTSEGEPPVEEFRAKLKSMSKATRR